MKAHISYFIISVTLLVTDFSFSQSFDFNNINNAFLEKDYMKLDSLLKSANQKRMTKYDKATLLYYYADFYYKNDRFDLAYKNIIESKNTFLELNKKKDAIDCNIQMIGILRYVDSEIDIDDIIEETEKFALQYGDSIALRTVYRRIGAKYIHLEKGDEAQKFFRKIIPIAIKLNDSIRIGYSYDNISLSFVYTTPPKLDSALYYNKLAIKFYLKYNDLSTLAYNYNNRGMLYMRTKRYKDAKTYFLKADSVPTLKNNLSDKILFNSNLSKAYAALNEYKKAYFYQTYSTQLKDSLNEIDQKIAISNIKEKYDNEKLKAEKLETEIKHERDKIFLLGTILFILIGSIISYLQIKSSRRKRILALQEKELEVQKNIALAQEKELVDQKNLTLLKEQEITTINAMVEGQEKERKRVAEDLHDNLGSVIATLKLHFDNLRINKEKKKIDQEALFEKTEKLIDEAYKKVRSIAHAKNAGVIANQGLLTAVEIMAEKISSATNDFQIQVVHSGLDTPLDNSLEISLFRIIQELTTNIIKHAEASFVTIGLNEHQEGINIMIEDNGKGMNISEVDLKNGMGLHSIQTRIEHLEGDFTIDSTPTKGTTIIINVPT